jgi:hypothetical protein
MTEQAAAAAISRVDACGSVSDSEPVHSQAKAMSSPVKHRLARRGLAAAGVAGLAVSLAACGGGQRAVVTAHVTVTSYLSGVRSTQSFSLKCRPVSGTLPFAARICGDIARHPQAMLRPLPNRWTCAGGPNMPELTITTTSGGKTATFAGAPGCGWPGGTPLAIYFAAARRDSHVLDLIEPRLRCEDDPVLLATPTPYASVAACVHGLWTQRTEPLIRLAEQAPKLAQLRLDRLFPHDIGARRCTIPAGAPNLADGPTYVGAVRGTCGVTVRNVWSTAHVAFVLTWPRTTNSAQRRHTWHVVIRRGRPVLLGERGPLPPQLRRQGGTH